MSFVKVNLVLKTDGLTDLSIEATCRHLKTWNRHPWVPGIFFSALQNLFPFTELI